MFPCKRFLAGAVLGAALGVSACSGESAAPAALTGEALKERGRYLVTIMTCTDCHTPGYFKGQPDMDRYLGGSDVGFEIPGLGVYYGPNLTSDPETGLGSWSEAQIVTALTAGERPDGRILAPIMPWRAYASLTAEDARAIAAYLKTVPPVKNRAPGPYGQSETPAAEFHRITGAPAPQP
jgi:mono/diheme cytochrome c family protein